MKHNLEIEEICCAINDRILSQMTPRLRAESTGESKLLGRIIELESCCGRSKMRNSV